MLKAYFLIVGLVMTIAVGSAVINLNYPGYKPTAEIVTFMRGH